MKRTYNTISAIFLLLALIVSMVACSAPASSTETADTVVSAAASDDSTSSDKTAVPDSKTADEAESYTVTDVFGREVEIPNEVQSVVALGSAARLMCYMDATEKLVGVTAMDLDPNAAKPYSYIYADRLANAAELATGGSNDTDYTEAIVATNPDVIFYFDSDTAAMDDLAQKTGLAVVGVYAENWYSEDTFYASLELIGKICGKEDRASELISALKGWKEELNTMSANVADADKPTVYAGAVSWSGAHGIEGTYGQYPPFVAVNAKNVVDETGAEAFVEIDREQIAAWDPDYIFLTTSNMDIVNEDYAQNPDFYNSLSAVKNGNVYSQVSFNYYWTNQELAVVNAFYVASVLYPDAFSDVNFAAKADEIFNTMLGSSFLDTLESNGMFFGPIEIGK